MSYLDETGVTALWNKIKANFAVDIEFVEPNVIQLKNKAATPAVLSSITLPDDGVDEDAINAAIEAALEGYSTTQQMNDAIATATTGAAKFQGTVSANSTITGSSYKKGWYWVVKTAGSYIGQTCEPGDMIFAVNDKASSYSAADFSIVQNNITTITSSWLESNLV